MNRIGRRQFVLGSSAGVLAALGQRRDAVHAAGPAPTPGPASVGPTRKGNRLWHTETVPADWHERYVRRFMVGQHIPDRDQADVEGILRDFDAKRLVRQVKQMGVQVFSFYAKCHRGNAYYPTRIGHRHSLMGDRGYLVLKSPEVVDPDSAFTRWIPFLDEGQVAARSTTSQALGVVGMRPGKPPGIQLTPVRRPTDAPALTCNRFGKGHAYYFAGRIGGVYARYNHPGIRRLIARLLAPHATGGMRVLTQAPGCIYVEVTRQQRPPRYVVHMMNAQSQIHRHWRVMKGGGQQFPPVIADETLPVHDVRLGLKPQKGERIRRAYQAPGGQSLPLESESDRVWTTVPCVRDYDLVVFDIE